MCGAAGTSATSRTRRPRSGWQVERKSAIGRVSPLAAQVPGSARACPVHLQLRGLEHERDDQRHHARTWTRPCTGVQAAITLFLLIMAILMIPCSKLTDRWGRKRCFTVGLVLYGIGALLSAVVAGARGADPRQLGAGGRRHRAADPARLHPHDAAVQRPHLARPGVRRHQRAGRHRRRGRTADRRAHHHRDQLAGRVRLPGRGRRADRPAQPPGRRSAAGRPDASLRRGSARSCRRSACSSSCSGSCRPTATSR